MMYFLPLLSLQNTNYNREEFTMAIKKTKINNVKQHLINYGSITSWDAIKLYNATRLSGIIFVLRQSGMNIISRTQYTKDCNGNTCGYARYILKEDQKGRCIKWDYTQGKFTTENPILAK